MFPFFVIYWKKSRFVFLIEELCTMEDRLDYVFFIDIPSRKLTYPPEKSILKMMFLFPRWDMLISWRVYFSLNQQKHLPATGTLSSVQWSLSDRHLGSLCEGAVSPTSVSVGWWRWWANKKTYPGSMGWKIWIWLGLLFWIFQVFC